MLEIDSAAIDVGEVEAGAGVAVDQEAAAGNLGGEEKAAGIV